MTCPQEMRHTGLSPVAAWRAPSCRLARHWVPRKLRSLAASADQGSRRFRSPQAAGKPDGLTLADVQQVGRDVGIEPCVIARAAALLDQGAGTSVRTFLGLPKSSIRRSAFARHPEPQPDSETEPGCCNNPSARLYCACAHRPACRWLPRRHLSAAARASPAARTRVARWGRGRD